ncbi:hypothetical protein PPERSA_00835 [Pseudocohnilembus persalinus]|uniref:Uncharacterized protein n=1 Tax=Pseudocohnilembus persalinus TaxID=266149 RepID=A0A0V0R7A2_PSEPJ|nr:hypothetical protein PPERSA_00835 [Pseudocohnilembus persalinus]|eukprot:KRX10355.1 hypothetical protein PPERSA_00835 [Pseudocohnilembus persalinus]
MMFYDSDIQSDNPEDFESDNEVPQDQVKDEKLITKDQLTRVHKQIFKVGRGINKPAKYDDLIVRAQKLTENPDGKISDSIQYIQNTKQYQVVLGMNSYPEWWELVVESMKQGEVSNIKIEHLKFDKNDMKVLDYEEYWLFELISWTTIIDLNMDKQWFKYITQKGQGQDKPEKHDELQFSYSLYHGKEKNKQLIAEQAMSQEPVPMQDLVDGEKQLPQTVWKIMRTMKKGEKVICKFHLEQFKKLEKYIEQSKINLQQKDTNQNENEKKQEYIKSDSQDSLENQQNQIIRLKQDPIEEVLGDFLIAEIEIQELVKVDDLFGDGSALKRRIYKGKNSSKVEKISLMKFEIEIYVDKQKIYSSVYKNMDLKDKEKVTYWEYHLDDFKLSKLLKHSLRRMKKGEVSNIYCYNSDGLIKNGRDFEIIKEKCGDVPKNIIYILKCIDYTEGRNNFNMTIDEKISHSVRKKQVGVTLIKEYKNYKKALKYFEAINAYFEYGTFYEEDKKAIYEHKLSALLNSGLCYQNLGQWDKLLIVSDKIFDICQNHPKAAYRKALALKNLEKYEQSRQFLENYLEQNKGQIEHDLLTQLEKLFIDVQNSEKKYKQKQKKMFQNMFNQ